MILTRTVAPTDLPVTVDEVKAALNVDFTDDDALIEAFIGAAVDAVEKMTGLQLMTQTWQMAFEDPATIVDLPRLPVQSVSSIIFYDSDNVSASASVSDYYLFGDDRSAWMEPKANAVWPAHYARADAITIVWVAGYESASEVPDALRQAVKMLTCHFYENRSAVGKAMAEVPLGVQSMIGLYRRGWVA